ncbi:MAG: helix-turn-helix domain-containing protein [Candidatus Heimdallarchaeota archaeon]|nr:helix-turn-helix domain-containing protein [Candidatus Heimdallarchaeota archaeon]
MATIPFLTKIGLSEEEQKVYLALLALGPLSAGEIAKYSGIRSISKVKTILEGLFNKNYAYNIEGLVDKAIGLYPYREIAAEAEKDSKKIDELVSELNKYILETIKHLEQVMADGEQFVRTEKKKTTEQISSTSASARSTIDNSTTEATNSIASSADSTKKRITSSANAFLKNQTENVSTFETATNENLDSFANELKSNVQSSLETLAADIETTNNTFKADGSAAVETASKAINQRTDKMADELKTDSQQKLEGTRDHVLNGLESFVNESEGNVKSFNEELMATTTAQAEHIKETTEEAKKNRIDMNQQFKAGLAESFEKVKTDIAQDLSAFQKKFIDKLTKIANKFKKQIDDLKDATAQDVGLLIEEANTTIAELTSRHNEEIAANVDLDNKAIEDGTSSMLAKVDEYNATAKKAIADTTETLKSSLTLLKANYSGDINSQIDETIKSMHDIISSAATETKETFNTTTTELTTKLDKLVTDVTAKSREITTTQTETIKGTTDSLVGTIKQKLGETKSTLLSETKKSKQKIAADTTSSVENISTTATNTMTQISDQAKTSIKNNEETTIKAIDTMSKIIEDTIRKEITATKGSLDEYGKRFAKDAAKIAKLLLEFRSQHEGLLAAVSEYPKPQIETAILYSKDAIFNRLDDILTTRIKSNVTMVIPDPTDIPTKTIAKVKAQAKITIISKIDEVAHKAIIDELRASDALQRIKIRKIASQDLQGFSEYIAFDIDGGEEMLIAFKDETEKDWVGILSRAVGFKNVVIGETLGRQALSISRELK